MKKKMFFVLLALCLAFPGCGKKKDTSPEPVHVPVQRVEPVATAVPADGVTPKPKNLAMSFEEALEQSRLQSMSYEPEVDVFSHDTQVPFHDCLTSSAVYMNDFDYPYTYESFGGFLETLFLLPEGGADAAAVLAGRWPSEEGLPSSYFPDAFNGVSVDMAYSLSRVCTLDASLVYSPEGNWTLSSRFAVSRGADLSIGIGTVKDVLDSLGTEYSEDGASAIRFSHGSVAYKVTCSAGSGRTAVHVQADGSGGCGIFYYDEKGNPSAKGASFD